MIIFPEVKVLFLVIPIFLSKAAVTYGELNCSDRANLQMRNIEIYTRFRAVFMSDNRPVPEIRQRSGRKISKSLL
jgi:hypothetical protein